MWPAGSGFLAISGAGAWVWEMAPSAEATPESAVVVPLQAIGMLGVPVTALPSGGLHPACACRRVPPREAAETPPCTALPRRAAHVLGSSTGRRSSPGGRRSWGRGRGRPVCRSSYASAHGALLFLASSHPPCAGIRSILLMPACTVPAAAVTLLVCAHAPELPHAGIASQMRPARSRPPQGLTDLASMRTGA